MKMEKTEIYKEIINKLWMVKEEVWWFEIELIDEVLNLIYTLDAADRKNKNLVENAFKLWKLVKLWQVKDAQFTDVAENTKKEIEVQIGDIVENYPELEELIPSPICFR